MPTADLANATAAYTAALPAAATARVALQAAIATFCKTTLPPLRATYQSALDAGAQAASRLAVANDQRPLDPGTGWGEPGLTPQERQFLTAVDAIVRFT